MHVIDTIQHSSVFSRVIYHVVEFVCARTDLRRAFVKKKNLFSKTPHNKIRVIISLCIYIGGLLLGFWRIF